MGPFRAAYTLSGLARIALGPRPAAAGNPAVPGRIRVKAQGVLIGADVGGAGAGDVLGVEGGHKLIYKDVPEDVVDEV